MKKIHLTLSILVLLITACSSTKFFPAPTPTLFVLSSLPSPTIPAPTAAPGGMTAAPTLLSTETLPASASLPTETLSFTSIPASTVMPTQSTPMFIGMPTSTTGPTSTETMAPTATATPTSQPLPTPLGPVFTSVTISGPQINWDATCGPNSVTMIVSTASGSGAASVLLVTRLKSKTQDVATVWNDAVSMHDDGLGTFSYGLSTNVIKYYEQFNVAWIQFQFVAVSSQNQVLGRTQIYENNLTIAHCP